ncbi:MAG TPA: dTMP kinase [Xanthobacteraceae bacterium]|nr:dTMP kinase [Xanthobacteraceae bacterium]
MTAKFITFEGGEGAGKSTQAALLKTRLTSMGIGVLLTREPGGSPGAEIIRHVLLSGAAKRLGPNAEALLFAAARADHLDTVIKPALQCGHWVICDRFLDSTRVYQGIVGKVDLPFIKGLEKLTVGASKPDLTFVLDLPAEIGLARAHARRGEGVPDRFETEDFAYHQALNAAFRAIAAQENQRCILIDANRPPERVAAEILQFVCKRLHPETAPLTLIAP